MPYTKIDLQTLYSLSPKDVEQTLAIAKLPVTQETYTDEEIQLGFDVIRGYLNNGQASDYAVAAQLFEQQVVATGQPESDTHYSADNSRNGTQPINPLSQTELLARATEQTKTRLTLIEAGKILAACGLPDQEEYTKQECDRFVLACELYKNQGKSHQEVSEHFQVSGANESDNLQQIVEQISNTAISAESGLMRLVDKVTDKQTEGLPKLVNQLYLLNASRKLAESRAHSDVFFAELEERIMTQISGKSRVHSLGTTWESMPNSLPPSSPKPMSLPEGSENGVTNE